jgi:paraquat-inducible protein B
MASKASPTAIGAFVLGAIALIVIGLLVFGSGQFFAARNTYVAYFPGSVQGLRVGAPVTFRGAQIGQVTQLSVLFDPESSEFRIPVVFEIEQGQVKVTGDTVVDRTDSVDTDAELQQLIDQGLRARLQTLSLVTGLLYVDLIFAPDSEVNLVGDDEMLEVPTLASTMEEVQQTVGAVMQDVPGMIANLNQLLKSVDSTLVASSGNFEETMANIEEITARLRDRRDEIKEIFDDARAAAQALRNTSETAAAIFSDNRERIATLITEWTGTATSVRRMADQVNNAIAENREGLEDFTSVGLYEWTGLAQDAQAAVAQIQRVAEQLERDPSRFLFGGQETGMRPEE